MIADNLSNKSTSKVKELKLTKTNLTDEALFPILKSLENNNNVTNLNIAKNSITDKSIDIIVSLISKNKVIKTLYLTNNNFSTLGKDKLKSYGGKPHKIYI